MRDETTETWLWIIQIMKRRSEMNNIAQKTSKLYKILTLSLFVLAFILSQADGALAQVSGSGTIGQIPKWTATSTLGNSVITESSGNIGIGITTPNVLLTVKKDAFGDVQMRINSGAKNFYLGAEWVGGVPAIGTNDANPMTLVTNNAERFRIDPAGNVGIGTPNPQTLLHLKSGDTLNKLIVDSGSAASQYSEIAFFDRGIHIWELAKTPSNDFGIYDSSVGYRMFFLKSNGNVGIGTTAPSTKLHVVGDITVTGNINAKYQDVAEWVPARTALSAGTVVVLDPEHTNQVMASALAYDTRVAGVISQQPGLILGEGGEGKVMVATTGRVRMKVDATKAPIRVGDLLVTSAEEGVAMRSEPLDLAGTKIHRPGTIIGKALEPLSKGKGEILVLLSMQ
jgi:hypothetical protein